LINDMEGSRAVPARQLIDPPQLFEPPAELFEPPGFSHVAVATGRRRVFVAGQTALAAILA
jgi:hypothetical protein